MSVIIQGLIGMYRRKRDAMLDALDEHFGPLDGAVTWTRPKGGMFIWFWRVPEGVDLGSKGPILPRCLEQGVIYIPGSPSPSRVSLGRFPQITLEFASEFRARQN